MFLPSLITDSCFLKRQGFPKEVWSILELDRNSISTIAGKTLGKVCKSTIKEVISCNWEEKLSKLSVQSRFLGACDGEI